MASSSQPTQIIASAPIGIPSSLDEQTIQITSPEFQVIRLGGEDFEFSKEHISLYPKLLDPEARYRINCRPIVKLIYGMQPSCISKSELDEPSEREIFLSNLAFFEIKLSPEVILHLYSDKLKQLELISAKIQKKSSKRKMKFSLKKSVVSFCEGELASFSDLYSDGFTPSKICSFLELGGDFLKALVIHDVQQGVGVVGAFIDKFLKKFLI